MSKAEKIYVASSWRNEIQPYVVAALRLDGFAVYDFKESRAVFDWADIDAGYERWTPEKFIESLAHPRARAAFESDLAALDWCEAGVLLLPCGRSAHLELGQLIGAGKKSAVLIPGVEFVPELMYCMAGIVTVSLVETVKYLREG